jgi:hypothetical protein
MDEIMASPEAGCEVSSDVNDQLKIIGMKVDQRSHLDIINILTLQLLVTLSREC